MRYLDAFKLAVAGTGYVLLLVGACTPAQLQIAQADIATAKPIVNAAACDAQAASNIATQVFTDAGNTGAAGASSMASMLLGSLCFTTAAPTKTP